MSHELPNNSGEAHESWLRVPSVTPEGAFSGGDMQHFTPCGFMIVADRPSQRADHMQPGFGLYHEDQTETRPIVVYRTNQDGTTDLACWGTNYCPGGAITVETSDLQKWAVPETALALHGLCLNPSRKYVSGGKVTDVPYTPRR